MQKAIVLLFLLLAVLGGGSLGYAQVVESQRQSSVAEAIAEAMNSNPEIQAAKKKVESARARAGQATYLEDPEVNLEAWGVPLNRPLSYRSANPIVLGLRQKVPFFGKRGLKGDIAAQEVKRTEEELRGKEIEIIAKVKSSYADFFFASKSIELQKELLELVRQSSLTAENLYRVGKAPQQDVIKALLEQTDALNKLTSAERDRTISQAKLNTLLNRSPSSPVSQLGELTLTPVSLQFSDLEKLVLQQRPELRALESEIYKSEKSLELARKNQKFPDFILGLQYWVAPDQSPKHMYTPMISLTIPFSPWTKGRHDYEVEEAIAERQMAKANRDAMRNMALSEVREMLAKVEAADKSLSFYQDGLLLQAQQSYGAAVAAYQTGHVNFMTLLDAQRTIRDSRLGYYKAMVDYEQSLADLDRAVGLDLSQFGNK
jgi:cobalt-zinc-cadmium efflux system outer membrane protein